MSVTLIDLAPWGFAPGDTYVFCVDCPDGIPVKAHRYSIRCTEHAMGARLADIRAHEGQEAADEIAKVEAEQQASIIPWIEIYIVLVGIILLGCIYVAATAPI